eukprot:TRINITY_DN9771_c0_g1_i1.p1 TRINITY_DN9771_c0_g1~~TRINITY_DN9771_c0_g1_i1.p1  ORF type:complete len:257 (+),score=75.73 TRINITY_DN9771_c0_g1_i1:53-823(+)
MNTFARSVRQVKNLSCAKRIVSAPRRQYSTAMFNKPQNMFTTELANKTQIRFNHHEGHCVQEVARVGAAAPAFTAEAVVGKEFKKVSLADYKGKYVVLFFYPFDFTFVCPTEIISFSNAAATFRQNGAEVVGISCDSKFTHLAWINTPRADGGLGGLDIPLVADFDKSIATKYGALLLDKGFPLRALYVIDDKGTVRHITMNDPPVGRNVDEVLRIVQAFQHTDKHGEVCPAGWKPGSATMIPDPTKSKEYFKKHH